MSDIFISYKREEQPAARKLADALEKKGWSVWWDPKLRAGEHFDDVIEKALTDAKCVIVLSSQLSVESRYVKDEANYALKREKLVPVARPVHTVHISKSFAMGKYEVTFEEFDKFAGTTGRSLPQNQGWSRGRRPVIAVSWEDVVAYAEWLSTQTGKRYRLPTEAEWEYAARAGTKTAYWWGNEIGRNRANCDGCRSQWDEKQTAPVGSFDPNPFRLHDTVGNVWEWTCSVYEKSYAGAETGCAHKGDTGQRVIHGGSLYDAPRSVRSAGRASVPPAYRVVSVGFRLAQDL